MTDLRIVFNRERGVWAIHRHGEFARYVRSFDTEAEAVEFVKDADR